MNNTERLQRIREIYVRIPKVNCQGKCQESCGPIAMTRLERKQLPDAIDQISPDLRCPLLTQDGKCSVYDNRPLVCRLWGVVKDMPCIFGCTPERILTESEEREILKEINELGHGVNLAKLFALPDALRKLAT